MMMQDRHALERLIAKYEAKRAELTRMIQWLTAEIGTLARPEAVSVKSVKARSKHAAKVAKRKRTRMKLSIADKKTMAETMRAIANSDGSLWQAGKNLAAHYGCSRNTIVSNWRIWEKLYLTGLPDVEHPAPIEQSDPTIEQETAH